MDQYYQGGLSVCSQCYITALMYVQAALREQPPIVMVVGNKTDRAEQRCVAIEDGRNLALVSTYIPYPFSCC